MATFGRFETVREMHRTGYTTVYAARAPESAVDKFAIKVFQPPSLLLEGGQAKTEIDLFLKSTKFQQKVIAGGAQHWASILQHGSSPKGAFYVTEKYEHSLQQLIDVRLKLSSKNLVAIVESVAKGLMELQELCGRPHGNLKATNVLIGGIGDLAQKKIVLCDPLSDVHIDTDVHRDNDLRAIAKLIYQLVVHQQPPRVDGWQAPDSKEWRSLGKQSTTWRNLCNRLLNAHVKPGTITIEILLDELAQLKKAKPVLSYPRLIAAGLALVVCAVTLYISFRSTPAEPEQWEQLCKDYFAWMRDLYQELGGIDIKDNQKAKKWRENKDLEKLVENITTAGRPFRFFTKEDTYEEILGETGDKGDTKKALEAIKYIKSFFEPDPNNPWPLLLEMNEAVNRFEKRGWNKPATYLALLVGSVRLEPNLADNIDKVLDLKDTGILNNIDSSLKQIVQYQETIKSSNDPILVKFDIYGEIASNEGAGTKDDLDRLGEKLQDVNSLAQEIAGYIKDDEIRHDLFRTYGEVYKSAKPIGIDVLRAWMKEVEQYRKIEYPSMSVKQDWKKIIEQTKKDMNDVLKDKGTTEETRVEVLKNKTELEKIEGKFADMPQTLQQSELFLIVRDKEEIALELTSWEEERNKIKQFALFEVSKLVPPAEWLKNVEQWKIAGTQEVNRYWLEKRDNILTEDVKDKLRSGDRDQLYTTRQKMQKIWDNLNKLNDFGNTLDRDFSKMLPLQKDHSLNINKESETAYYKQKEEVFRSIIGEFPEEEVPDINDPTSFKQEWNKEITTFREHSKDLCDLIKAFYMVHERFKSCYLLEDELTENHVDQFDKLHDKLKGANVFMDIFSEKSSINTAFQELKGRVANLKAIQEQDEKEELVKIAKTATQTETVYAAWIRLGELPDPQWPNEAQDWQNDKQIQKKLQAEFETIKREENQTRGDSLLNILDDTGLKREIIFKQANIQRYKTIVKENSLQVYVLDELAAFTPDISEVNDFENLTKTLAEFVTSEDWRKNKYRTDLFEFKPEIITMQTFHEWHSKIKDYRILDPDPRDVYSWEQTMAKIRTELSRVQIGQNTEELRSSFTDIESKINKILKLPPIDLHSEDIEKSSDYWQELMEIKRKLKPEYCKRLELSEDGQLVFAATTNLDPNLFEPVIKKDTDKFESLPINSWDEFRTSGSLRTEFFYKTEGDDNQNIGWPKYVQSEKDPSVIFSFIPGDDSRGMEPFYMATHEITNAQFASWLNKTSIDVAQLLDLREYQYPLPEHDCRIKRASNGGYNVNRGYENFPVTWVTYNGAKEYAKWLGGQLPIASQHEYASRGEQNSPPQALEYVHIRKDPWAEATNKYNRFAETRSPGLEAAAPLGAVKPEGFEAGITIIKDTTDVHKSPAQYQSAWPIAISHDDRRANSYGLYDTIGNVWEWCTDTNKPVICGCSCLSPTQHTALPSQYNFKSHAECDVGFRIVAPVK